MQSGGACPPTRRRRERCRPNDVNVGGRCLAVAWPMMFCCLGSAWVIYKEVVGTKTKRRDYILNFADELRNNYSLYFFYAFRFHSRYR
ncbi:hypothetical protein AVEN_532-1 [Araneus ventricosus]|uniref:Uncharacterized protein n=1 Tax=Araneus ventricosus TaxID=182803 RepID=A0A4Y2I8Y7_ARAVE|nr:hypothetical protein AVEN_532-1 [Araneus ventricosus]